MFGSLDADRRGMGAYCLLVLFVCLFFRSTGTQGN